MIFSINEMMKIKHIFCTKLVHISYQEASGADDGNVVQTILFFGFLHITSSLVKIRLHSNTYLPSLLRTVLKVTDVRLKLPTPKMGGGHHILF